MYTVYTVYHLTHLIFEYCLTVHTVHVRFCAQHQHSRGTSFMLDTCYVHV